ncbi:MAG: hypothetical protein GX985_01725 [Gallicola sp.]|nr:hypothetical protein [Gallicola sp.]
MQNFAMREGIDGIAKATQAGCLRPLGRIALRLAENKDQHNFNIVSRFFKER